MNEHVAAKDKTKVVEGTVENEIVCGNNDAVKYDERVPFSPECR